jgi:S-DNA-T family DNA segregation ATPase FtsK/SpoIIIE
LVSPAIRALIGRRLGELSGIALALTGIALLVALATYNPRDPSLNTATSQHATNMGGPAGAVLADFLLQGFGLAGVLPGIALPTWGWLIASPRGFGSAWLRILPLILALPAWSVAFATVSGGAAWPTSAGPGGAAGHVLAVSALDNLAMLPAPAGAMLLFLVAGVLAIIFTATGLGLSFREWRFAGRTALGAARLSAAGGQRAAGLFTRAATAPQAASMPPPRPEPIFAPAPAAPHATAPREDVPQPAIRMPPPAPMPQPHAKPRVAMPERRAPLPRQEILPLVEEGWRLPPVNLLKPAQHGTNPGASAESLEANARLLESVLADFGVHGAIRDIRPGPVVTMYELEPAPGIRSARACR